METIRHQSVFCCLARSAGLWAFCASLLAAGVVEKPSVPDDFEVGKPALEDVIAPFDIEVLNAHETARARHVASVALPEILVGYRDGGKASVEAIRTSFVETRNRFTAAVENTFNSYPISHREANSSRFRDFRVEFQRTNPDFPVGNLLGLTWALGRDDDRLLSPVIETIASAYDGKVVVPDETGVATAEVVLLSPSESEALAQGGLVPDGERLEVGRIESLDAVRDAVRLKLEVTYRPVSAFVCDRLEPNARVDERLTDTYRDRTTGSIRVVTEYEAGDLILAKGQPVTAEALQAVREIAARQRAAMAIAAPSGIVASHPGVPVHQDEQVRLGGGHELLLGFLACAVIALLIALVFFTRRQREQGLLLGGAAVDIGRSIPDGLAAQLARELRDRVVQSLYTQRDDLLRAEKSATVSVRELEARLARLQPKILEKIRAYEDRIAELEEQLERKESENRELIQARIDEVREKLNAELARHDIILN